MAKSLSSGFEQDLGTLLVGVDTLWGGNIKGGAADRFILDHWISDKELPPIYNDLRAQALREGGGISGISDHELVMGFVRAYDLLELASRVQEEVPANDYFRMRYIENLTHALEIMVHAAIATVDSHHSMPSFDERRRATTREKEITLVDVRPLQEQLREALSHAGVESTERNVRDRYLAWKAEWVVPKEQVGTQIFDIKQELFALLQERFFAQNHDIFEDGMRLKGLTLQGHTFQTTTDKAYTGFSQYDGGVDGRGWPLFRGLFEFNVEHPVTRDDLYHLTAHEVIAHYVSCVVRDLSYRSGKHGLESTMGTMCSPEVALEEGLAETMIFLLYGSRDAVIEHKGPGMGVVLAVNDLENAAKYNVGILYQREGKSIDEVRAYVAEQCLLDDAFVDKMSRAWARHPIFGPMYGPAYHYGAKVVRSAVSHLGDNKILRWAFHLDGLLDILTFDEKVNRKLL